MRVVKVLWAVVLVVVAASWGLAQISPAEEEGVTGEVKVLTTLVNPRSPLAARTCPLAVIPLKPPPEITMAAVMKAFGALKGGDAALTILRQKTLPTGPGALAQPLDPNLTVVLTPLVPVVADPGPFPGTPPFWVASLHLWNIDAVPCYYTELSRMCAENRAYFMDRRVGSAAWDEPPLSGRINGWFFLTKPGWYLFVAQVQGLPTIRFTSYVNGTYYGTFTVTGWGVMPILVYVTYENNWYWVRFDQTAIPPTPPQYSGGAFTMLKAEYLGP